MLPVNMVANWSAAEIRVITVRSGTFSGFCLLSIILSPYVCSGAALVLIGLPVHSPANKYQSKIEPKT